MAKGVYRWGAVSREVRSAEFTTGTTNAGVMELKKRNMDCIIHGNAIISIVLPEFRHPPRHPTCTHARTDGAGDARRAARVGIGAPQ